MGRDEHWAVPGVLGLVTGAERRYWWARPKEVFPWTRTPFQEILRLTWPPSEDQKGLPECLKNPPKGPWAQKRTQTPPDTTEKPRKLGGSKKGSGFSESWVRTSLCSGVSPWVSVEGNRIQSWTEAYQNNIRGPGVHPARVFFHSLCCPMISCARVLSWW